MLAFKLKSVVAAVLMTCTIGYGAYCALAGDEPGSRPTPNKRSMALANPRDQIIDPTKPDTKPAKKAAEIEVRGNQLVVTSDDKDAIAVLASLARYLTSMKSDEVVFKVIRLKNVRAEDAAKTINQIFNGPQPQGGGLGGAAILGATPGRVRVVADESSNSIVVIKASGIDLLAVETLLSDYIDGDVPKNSFMPDAKEKQPFMQPKTFDLTIHGIKLLDGKQPEISFYLDRYYPEFDDNGVPRGKPLAKEVEVLIDGKKGKITDLAPGDKVTVQLAPDKKSITRIELDLKAIKARLEALEKEAEALRQRLRSMEKGK
jgi:hypothetical protein